MHHRFPILAALVGLALAGARAEAPPPLPDIEPYRAAAERWEPDIAALEQLDSTETLPADGILFIGSSSIRRWDTIGEDMAPYQPIRRGYGGAKFSDLVFYADRLTAAHKVRAIVVFVANDISGRDDDRSPEEVAGLLAHVIATIRASHPTTPVFYVAVTPTESRYDVWDTIRAGNSACQALCDALPNVHFIPTASAYLRADGTPRADLFVDDRLHLNESGYDLWAAIIKSHLDGVLGGATP